MRLPLLIFVLLLTSIGMTAAADEPKPGQQVAQEFQNPKDPESKLGYLLYLPQNYGQTKEPSPLLLFLHGSGERGQDISQVKKHGPPKLIGHGQQLPFVVVSPQCPDKQRWDPDLLLALLDDLAKKYSIDATRVYVTGLSMGGSGTWSLVAAAPDRFAAAIPICGRAADTAIVEQAAQLPIWIVVGDRDNKQLVENCIEMEKLLQGRKADVKLTIMHGVGHDSWTQTYDTPEVYEWLLRHRKAK
ncbi:MAG TPA: prolyl oligopeptidase family serine peptidase [Schlesneria sp.]